MNVIFEVGDSRRIRFQGRSASSANTGGSSDEDPSCKSQPLNSQIHAIGRGRFLLGKKGGGGRGCRETWALGRGVDGMLVVEG